MQEILESDQENTNRALDNNVQFMSGYSIHFCVGLCHYCNTLISYIIAII